VENVGKRYEAARQAVASKTDVKAEAAKPDPASVDPAGAKPPQERYSTLQQYVDEYGRLHLTTAP
jgi:hypothetical protein